ncbi:cystathionine gamma-synthase [Paenibacillus dendritiformis]|uniref:aminotransferase class I/II-fold pyridoxal phosphate-dependent enzyme n=1 Tax=Paenibacillus dendritiformis TaxID=130049 RepID=UPI0018CEF40F|nr:aminotransferase class I/II-fold pyridoxal phosphate-dependent enzyme [Paenibacillus dendritiformis]MBG9791816.1 cystathionine gamma-synthase [Paenibacillus dendritiformis]
MSGSGSDKARPASKRTQGLDFATKLIHFGGEIDKTTGASSVSIYQATTFHHYDIYEPPEFDYSRSGNPTRQALEDHIALLEGGTNGYAFASGMAAISSAFLLFSAGDHIIVTEDVYGGTYRLLTTILNRLRIESTFVDMTDIEQVKAALRPNTKAVYMETPSNPTLKITDMAEVCGWAKEHGLLTLLDNTFMTPYHQLPIVHGVDIVLHSATKFLSGHSDVLAGLLVTATEELGARIKQLQNGLGTVLGVQDSWLLMRGLPLVAVSLGAVESILSYPAMMSHASMPAHVRLERGITDGLLRFSVGLEHIDDLLQDLDQVLSQ